ncbi:hypothetical protein KAFR_0B02810 [Kazachstania africana CBS 2517]|uniref:Uncharacterized protein n=1 Tax=Kazachstania africana (strain ATCC 22294 / BCRC 22015 / CBS 2517 / CECT 1963 / NBRC 1671 / NRRL Y-8276) TaxID=1071382 RepID=H2AQC8_KAZAF|nr:hypothetical protein KAFR_0B02810 [Kazachstania africana CBS 2517]CCF56578.1 hypothetical protein KAFR_0B02810 [Kazachstania africana CBS 2517]
MTRTKVLNPRTEEAISIWEKGVSKEKDGSMSDAINFYRRALKLDENVEKIYRKKLYDEWNALMQMKKLSLSSSEETEIKVAKMEELEDIEDVDESILPCWILDMLPNDILLKIVGHVVFLSGESWVNLSLTCSRFNDLCFRTSTPYKAFKDYIYPKQVYDNEAMYLNGISTFSVLEKELWGDDYAKMIKDRPFIKFEGVYISVVNYLRYGSNEEGSFTLLNPIQMITYYRYYRFYEDGKVLRLLTTDEPQQIVKTFSRETQPREADLCSWNIGFDNNFGRLQVSRSNDKYIFVETLEIKNQGHRIHHRLKWISSTVEDNEGHVSECSLKNEKAFFFSRVKSFATKDS